MSIIDKLVAFLNAAKAKDCCPHCEQEMCKELCPECKSCRVFYEHEWDEQDGRLFEGYCISCHHDWIE